jgi:hypothetical protein
MRPAALLLLLLAFPAAADDAFRISTLAGDGRTVAAEIVDLNGDGRTDVLQILFAGHPPSQRRRIRVFLQNETGQIGPKPSFEFPLPPGTAAYDVSDLRETPGTELILLRQRDVTILSLAGPEAEVWELPFPGVGRVGAQEDERGLERIPIAFSGLGPAPTIVVTQIGRLVIISATGEILASLEADGRANYLVPIRPGFFFFESDFRLFFDAPRLSVADVNGDGQNDLITSTSHHIRVFLQKADGGFKDGPADQVLSLTLLSERDHIRGSGGVTAQAVDLNHDRKADLLLSHQSGGLTNARLITRVYLNQNGTWRLSEPDRTFDSEGAIGSEIAVDLDHDGRPELLRVIIPFSTLGLVETLLTRSIDTEVLIYQPDSDSKAFTEKPWVELDFSIPFSFDTFRPSGFVPSWDVDVNADGHLDLLTSGDGDRMEVNLGGPEYRYKKREAKINLESQGQLRSGDINGDGLPDLMIFDPFTPEAPIQLLQNLGTLSGSPSLLKAAEAKP